MFVLTGGLPSALNSPLVASIKAETPAITPPSKSPLLNLGVMTRLMILPANKSVNRPSSPRPTSIRIFRSCLAISRIIPLSLFFCPIFQASATLMPNSSMVSPCNDGMVKMTNWVESDCSKAFSSPSKRFSDRRRNHPRIIVDITLEWGYIQGLNREGRAIRRKNQKIGYFFILDLTKSFEL